MIADTPSEPVSVAAADPSYADVHRALGAVFSPYRGVDAVASYASAENGAEDGAEDEAAATGCAVFDRGFCDRWAMTGADRQRFLNGQVTCDVGTLTPGAGTYGFVTTIKGKVEADLAVLALDDRLWLDLPPTTADAVRARLEKYVIVDRVAFEPLDWTPLTLLGADAEALVSRLCAAGSVESPTESHHHAELPIETVTCRLVRGAELPVAFGSTDAQSTWDLWVPTTARRAVLDALRQRGAVAIGWQAFERRRIEAGLPLWGIDFGIGEFPQETGLAHAVSYTKGCYLGQEVVARIHYRGGVQRHLRGLELDAEAPVGAALRVPGDREVGRLTSVVRSARRGSVLGLAVVHQRAEPGATVEVVDGDDVAARARLVALDA